jgi:predicted DNA-binding ribbon-helix-helix protein
MKIENYNKNYKSVRVKTETYKKLKLLAVEMEVPITQLIDLMHEEHLKSRAHLTSPP